MKIYSFFLIMLGIIGPIFLARGQGPDETQICPGDILHLKSTVIYEWQSLYNGFTRFSDEWSVKPSGNDVCGETLHCGNDPLAITYKKTCQICYHEEVPDWQSVGSGTLVTFYSYPTVENTVVHFRYRKDAFSPWNNAPDVAVLRFPPVLLNVPQSSDTEIDTKSEVNYISPTINIEHVKCKSTPESNGRIIIKSISGGSGTFKYSLQSVSSNASSNITRIGFPPPSPSNPIVFPDQGDNYFPLKGGAYVLTIENLVWDGANWIPKCPGPQYEIYIKEPKYKLGATATPLDRNGYSISCPGANDGQIQITPSGGIGPYQISWNGGAFKASTTISGLGPSTGNRVDVMDALGCLYTINNINITEPPALTFNAPVLSTLPEAPNNISCFGGTGSIQISASGGAGTKSYQLLDAFGTPVPGNDTPDSFNPDPVFDGIPAGIYTVRVKDQNGCIATTSSSIELIQPTDLSLAIGTITPPSCLGGADGKVQLVPSGGIPKSGDVYKVTIVGFEVQPSKNKTGASVELTDFESGTYTVRVEGKYCSKDFTASLVIPDNPLAVNFDFVFEEPTCNGLADGSISITGKNGFPFNADEYKFSFDSEPFTSTVSNSIVYNTNISAGVYSIGIKDSKNCLQYNNVIVTEPSLIANTFSITENICRGENGGEILATISGATAPYTVEWRDASNTNLLKSETVASASVLSALAEGDYKLAIKDDQGCTNHETDWYTLTAAITDPDFLLLGHSFFDNVSCNGAGDGEVTLLAAGGWSGYTYSKNGGPYVGSANFQNLVPGDYEFTVRDSRGCETSYARTVTEPATFTSELGRLENVKCFGGTTGLVDMNLAGGTTPYELSFNGGTDFTPGHVISVLPQGNHTILARDAHGCTASVPVTITEPPLLEIDLTRVVHTLCGYAHGEGTVEARGGTLPFAYDWKTSGGISVRSQPDVKSLYPDAYTVTVTDGNLCTADVLVLVNNTDGPTITNTVVADAVCSYSNEGAIDLTASGGQLPYQYHWSNGQSSEDVSGLTKGNYLVEVRDGNDCRVYKEIKVGAPDKLDAQILSSIEPSCFDFTDGQLEVAARGGNGGYTYQWGDGSTSSQLQNLSAGNYSVTITDVKGCVYEETFVLQNPERFKLDLGPDRTICVGQVFEADGGTAVAYQWTSDKNFSASSRTVTLTEPAVYHLKVADSKGCIAEDEFVLDTSLDLLQADFVMATQGYAKDTIVALDISWPLPERIEWTFDNAAKIIYKGQDRAEAAYGSKGDYTLTLTTALAECRATYTKAITILDELPTTKGGRTSTESTLFSRFDLFPNPSDGNFRAEVELNEGLPIHVNMVDMSSNRNVFSRQLTGNGIYSLEVKVDVGTGVYAFTVQAGKEIKSKRIIISK